MKKSPVIEEADPWHDAEPLDQTNVSELTNAFKAMANGEYSETQMQQFAAKWGPRLVATVNTLANLDEWKNTVQATWSDLNTLMKDEDE